MTDDAPFEGAEAPEGPRCPACLATVEPDQRYCLDCGERLEPAVAPGGAPFPGLPRRQSAALVTGGAVLLLAGGFGIAYGFTRDDGTKAAGGTTTGRRTTVSLPTASVPTTISLGTTDTGIVPTFTETSPTDTGTPTFTEPTTPTDTGVETTDSTPTTTEPTSDDWPDGTDAFAVLLASKDTEQFDFAFISGEKSKAQAKGFSNAGVLNSDDYFTLNPGYWVLFLGPYETKAEAETARGQARAAGYSDAYIRRVAE